MSYLVMVMLVKKARLGLLLIAAGIVLCPLLQAYFMYTNNTDVYWDFSTPDYLYVNCPLIRHDAD